MFCEVIYTGRVLKLPVLLFIFKLPIAFLLDVVQVDPVRRMFDILRKEDCRWVAPDDLKSMMAGILLSHPGLEFLQETPEFQDR